jgi:hemerythrin-like metal-binding protein
MPYILWDASMSVGLPELDEQHREFIAVLNDLHDTLMEGTFSEVVQARDRTLEGMERYVDAHFASEEAYMERIGYAGLAGHRALHEAFSRQVHGYREAIAKGEQVLNSELVRTMIRWLRDHLETEDRKYALVAAGHAGR